MTSQPMDYSKIGLGLAIIILSAVFGAIGGATYMSQQPQPKSTGITPQTIGTGLWLVTMSDTTANRALNTAYRNVENNGGQAMIVQVFLRFGNRTSTASPTIKAYVNQTKGFLNDTLSSGIDESLKGYLSGNLNATTELAFYVPWGFYYSVNLTTGTPSPKIILWLESIPPTGFGFIIQAIPLLRRLSF